KLAFAQNNTNQAAEYIAKVLAQSPDDRDAILNRSRLKLASRDIQSALADLEQLSNANPRDSDALFQLAVAQFASDNPSQAFISVNKAISANTNHVEAYLLRARLQVLRSDWNNAIPELTQLIRRFPPVAQAYYL